MQQLIDTSTAFYGGGNTPTNKLFKLSSGSYAGRLLAIYSQSATTIKFSYADPPYTSWSTPTTIASNAADYPVSGWMDEAGNIYVVYTKATTLDLLFRKLTLVAGEWTVGSEVTVYNDKDNYFPSIVKQDSGKLNLCWSSYDAVGSDYSIRYKSSTDDGATWGGGPADAGTELLGGSTACYCQLVYLSNILYCIYTDSGTTLAYRDKDGGAALWNSAVTLYSGSGLDDSLSAAVSEAGSLVGVAFKADSKLRFLEFDTVNWSSPFEIAASPGTPPKLLFNGAIPYVIYGLTAGSGQVEVKFRYKQGSGFGSAQALHDELATFAAVKLFDADAGSPWFDRTSEAGDDTAADVYHPTSSKLVQAIGDVLYCGSAEKFASLSMVLSTAGDAVGRVNWSYYDGTGWVEFTPQSGAYHLDQTSKLVRLWTDSAGAPAGWQKNEIDGDTLYWIKIEVTGAYSTAPVGSQLTPLTDLKYLTN
jgi:hypothetical protein